jgi:5-hydroxyisourate hydrolase-like protein (transthyretin family)
MKKSFLLLSAGIIALLFACSGDVAEHENFQPPIQTEAKLTVVVIDVITGSLVSDAEVTLLSADKKGTTNSEGIVIFKDIHVGSHRLLIKKDGYADIYRTTSIDGSSDENIHIAEDNITDVYLYPENAGLWGHVYYMNKKGQKVPAEDVKVYIKLENSDYNEKQYPATTNEDGKYEFSKLPPGVYYTIWAEGKVIDGIAFERLDMSYLNLISNGKVYKDEVVLQENNSLFEVVSYKNILEKNEALVFTFTDSVNVELLVARKMIELKYVPFMSSADTVLANISWSEDYKKLTIAPPTGGKWKGNFEVRFNGLKSTNGKDLVYSEKTPAYCKRCDYDYYPDSWGIDKNWCDNEDGDWIYDLDMGTNVCKLKWCYNDYSSEAICRSNDYNYGDKYQSYTWIDAEMLGAYYPITIKQADLSAKKIKVDTVWVSSDSIDHTSQYINLRWDKVEGADEPENYRILRKIGSKGGYEPITAAIKKGTRMYADNVPLNIYSYYDYAWNYGSYIKNDTVSFIVEAFNGTSRSFLDTTAAYRADVRDIVAPRLASSPLVWDNNVTYLGYYLNLDRIGPNPDWVGNYYLYFDEPMDTTEVRVEWTKGRLLVESEWINGSNGMQLRLTLWVKPGPAITGTVSEAYPIARLKDRAGNNLVGSGIVNGTVNIPISVDKTP